MEGLVTRKCQICQKKDVKELHSFIVGHFIIRERRVNLKQYCVLFTRFSSRAVRIEVTCTMETISCRMEQIGLHGTKIHLVLHICVESGSARFEVLEVSLLPY